MPIHEPQHLKRANLYLVRVWNEDGSVGDGGGAATWHGRVQRVVDGESHPFNNWQDLINVLQEMLAGGGDGPQAPAG